MNIRIKEEIIAWREQSDGNVVIFSPELPYALYLNEVASVIWKLLVKGETIETIAEKLSSIYDVAKSKAKNDILEFIEELKKLEVIEVYEK